MKLEYTDQIPMSLLYESFREGKLKERFHYENDQSNFEKRIQELSNRTFKRKELSDSIRHYMTPFGISEKANEHLRHLEDNAVVVIGGQQAGLLTGPLYSFHKIVSILLLAKEQSQLLTVPVVPVFWIAGEDHDFLEIASTYALTGEAAQKFAHSPKFAKKSMVSHLPFDTDEVKQFVESVFRAFGETVHTRNLKNEVVNELMQSKTYTEFFSRLIARFFNDYGLLFIDAADENLREVEQEYFHELIERNDELREAVVKGEKALTQLGFSAPLEVEDNQAHLFLVENEERGQLKIENDAFVLDLTKRSFTKDELLAHLHENPQLFSNNVATRPLMQDFVFPVLAFVGGPGEIAYWAALKEAFEVFNIQMPLVIPRLSISIVNRRCQKLLHELSLTVPAVLSGEGKRAKQDYMASMRNEEIDESIQQMQASLEKAYDELTHQLLQNDFKLDKIVQQNLQRHERQFDYLKQKLEDEFLLKIHHTTSKYDYLNNLLLPEDGLQERLYSPYVFINEFGASFVEEFMNLPFSFDHPHQIVYL